MLIFYYIILRQGTPIFGKSRKDKRGGARPWETLPERKKAKYKIGICL